jgi:hypothetical protein
MKKFVFIIMLLSTIGLMNVVIAQPGGDPSPTPIPFQGVGWLALAGGALIYKKLKNRKRY